MKPKIEVGRWKTRGGFIANVTNVTEELSWGCLPGIDGGEQVCWNTNELKTHDPEKQDWDLVDRLGDLPSYYGVEIQKPSNQTTKPSTLEVRATQWTITPTGKPIFDERAITLCIEDEAGGEFLTIRNGDESNGGSFRFDPEEWPVLRALIDEAIKGVRK